MLAQVTVQVRVVKSKVKLYESEDQWCGLYAGLFGTSYQDCANLYRRSKIHAGRSLRNLGESYLHF